MAPRKAPAKKSTRAAVSTRGKTVAEAAKAARGADGTTSALAGGPVSAEPKAEEASDIARAAKVEVEAVVARDEERGYIGDVFDPHPNEAYSIQSGPDSPPVNG